MSSPIIALLLDIADALDVLFSQHAAVVIATDRVLFEYERQQRAMGVAKVAKTTKPAVAENRVQNRIQRTIRDIRSELKKVVWPSREEATNLTMIVIGVSVAVGMFLGGVDFVFKKIFELIIGGF